MDRTRKPRYITNQNRRPKLGDFLIKLQTQTIWKISKIIYSHSKYPLYKLTNSQTGRTDVARWGWEVQISIGKTCGCLSPRRHINCQYCGTHWAGEVVCGVCKETGIDGKLIPGTGRITCKIHQEGSKP